MDWIHDLAESQADSPTVVPLRVAVDEKQIEIDGEKMAAHSDRYKVLKLLLEIEVYSRRKIGPAATFLHRVTEKHDVSNAEFLVEAGEYLTAFFRYNPSS